MVEKTSTLTDLICRYQRKLEQENIRCERILLFGSHRWGTAYDGSDIDLIVVSPDWGKYSSRERLEIMGVAAARILEPIQAQGFTPEEIASRKLSPFWQNILDSEAIVV
jgi:predicted nucleotidyltransferase